MQFHAKFIVTLAECSIYITTLMTIIFVSFGDNNITRQMSFLVLISRSTEKVQELMP